jgi:hypothetical protein
MGIHGLEAISSIANISVSNHHRGRQKRAHNSVIRLCTSDSVGTGLSSTRASVDRSSAESSGSRAVNKDWGWEDGFEEYIYIRIICTDMIFFDDSRDELG